MKYFFILVVMFSSFIVGANDGGLHCYFGSYGNDTRDAFSIHISESALNEESLDLSNVDLYFSDKVTREVLTATMTRRIDDRPGLDVPQLVLTAHNSQAENPKVEVILDLIKRESFNLDSNFRLEMQIVAGGYVYFNHCDYISDMFGSVY